MFLPGDSGVADVLASAGRLGVEGLEVLVTRSMVGRLRDVAAVLQAESIQLPAVHAPKRLGAALPTAAAVAELEESAWFAAAVGASVLVLHLWDLPEADTRFDERLDALVVAADVVAPHGVVLAVETIPCQVATPLGNIERVLERDDRVGVALDTEFLAMHGELEAALSADWLWHAGRVRHVHIKDFDGELFDGDGGRRYLLPGAGSISFVGLFDTLERRGFTGAVSLEASAHLPDGTPDLVAIGAALSRMSHSPWRYSSPAR